MLSTKLAAASAAQLALSWFIGLAFIPILRKWKTGVYTPYIGDRYSTDGSEPAFGGVSAWVVFAFGAALLFPTVSADERISLLAAVVFSAALTFWGTLNDIMTDVGGKPYGVKGVAAIGWCCVCCFAFVAFQLRRGAVGHEILLPFGIGIVDLGEAFCPATAAAMTAVVYSFKYLNRFGCDEKSCVGGLCYAVTFAAAAGFGIAAAVIKNVGLLAFATAAAAAACGAMIWGLSPSKQKSGDSGGIFCGSICAAAMGFAGYYQAAFLLCAFAALTDGICTLAQYLHFRRTKKLLLSGNSLHGHMRAKGLSDYAVTAVFFGIALLGAAAGAALAVYGEKRFF